MVSGIYPPLAPIGQPQNRQFTEKEVKALDTWVEVLKEGEANVKVEDRIDSVRFSKVSRLSSLTVYPFTFRFHPSFVSVQTFAQ